MKTEKTEIINACSLMDKVISFYSVSKFSVINILFIQLWILIYKGNLPKSRNLFHFLT